MDLPNMDQDNIERRLSALEAENRALRAKVIELESGGIRKALRSRVSHACASRIQCQSAHFQCRPKRNLRSCLTPLGALIQHCYRSTAPPFEGSEDERREQYRKQFESSFLAVGNMRRLDRTSTKVYLSFHIQVAETILRRLGRPMSLRGNPFLAAVLSHYDVPISGIGRHHEGHVIEIGLDEFNGKIATDAWRKILAGEPPREVGVQRRQAPANPVRIHAPGY